MSSEEDIFWFDHLTPEQQTKLDELRRGLDMKGLLVEGLAESHALLRFLKARQWSVHKAEKMYEVRTNNMRQAARSSACPGVPAQHLPAAACSWWYLVQDMGSTALYMCQGAAS
jgi:hypothetical protein